MAKIRYILSISVVVPVPVPQVPHFLGPWFRFRFRIFLICGAGAGSGSGAAKKNAEPQHCWYQIDFALYVRIQNEIKNRIGI